MKKDTIYETAMLFCFLAMPLGMLLLALSACEQPEKPKHVSCYKRDKPQCWSKADWEVVCEHIHCR